MSVVNEILQSLSLHSVDLWFCWDTLISFLLTKVQRFVSSQFNFLCLTVLAIGYTEIRTAIAEFSQYRPPLHNNNFTNRASCGLNVLKAPWFLRQRHHKGIPCRGVRNVWLKTKITLRSSSYRPIHLVPTRSRCLFHRSRNNGRSGTEPTLSPYCSRSSSLKTDRDSLQHFKEKRSMEGDEIE